MKKIWLLLLAVYCVGCAKPVAPTCKEDEQSFKANTVNVVQSHLSDIKKCYVTLIEKNPHSHGNVTLIWGINPTGNAVDVKVKSSTVNSKELEDCTVRAVSTWIFPKGKCNFVTYVSYPINFQDSP